MLNMERKNDIIVYVANEIPIREDGKKEGDQT